MTIATRIGHFRAPRSSTFSIFSIPLISPANTLHHLCQSRCSGQWAESSLPRCWGWSISVSMWCSFPINGRESPLKNRRFPKCWFWMILDDSGWLKPHFFRLLTIKNHLDVYCPSSPGFRNPVTVVSAHCRLMTPFFQAASWMSYSSSLSWKWDSSVTSLPSRNRESWAVDVTIWLWLT